TAAARSVGSARNVVSSPAAFRRAPRPLSLHTRRRIARRLASTRDAALVLSSPLALRRSAVRFGTARRRWRRDVALVIESPAPMPQPVHIQPVRPREVPCCLFALAPARLSLDPNLSRKPSLHAAI